MNEPKAYGICSFDSNAMKSSNPNSGIYEADTSRTLDLNGGSPACNQGGMMVVQPTMVLNDQGGQQMSVSYDVTSTLRAEDHQHPPLVMNTADDAIPINTMVATRDTPEMRTTFGVGEPGDPQFTISAAHSHAVFVEDGPTYSLDEKMGQTYIWEDQANTLAQRDYKQPQAVFSAGFKPRQGATARSLGYEEEMAPTINTDENYAVLHANGFSYGQSSDARSLGYHEEVSPTIRGGEGGNQKPCVFEERVAIPVENHPNDSRCKLSEDGVVQTLSGRMGTGGNNTPLVMERRFSDVRISEEDIAPTIESGAGDGGNNLPMVMDALPFDTTQVTCPNNYSHPHPGDPCHPLAATAHPPAVCYGLDQQGGKGGANYTEEVSPPILSDSHGTPHAIAFTQNQREEVRDLNDTATAIHAEPGMHQQTYVATCIGNGQADIASHISEEVAQTLNCMHDQLAVCVGNGQTKDISMSGVSNSLDTMHVVQNVMTAVDCRNGSENANVNGTLQAKEQGQNLNSNNVCRTGNTVRRLTPKECERLQAFPDNWTNIGEWVDSAGKKHKNADSPRYKALGNNIALPFWDWLLGRITAQYDRPATLGSLFDGIGGFPICWEHHNGRGTALWASEIEEFPIAVTKLHFPEDEDGNRSD